MDIFQFHVNTMEINKLKADSLAACTELRKACVDLFQNNGMLEIFGQKNNVKEYRI